MRLRSPAWLLLGLSACVDPAGIDVSTRILCDADDDCPAGWACRDLGAERRCLAPPLADDDDPLVIESLEAPVVARGDFTVDFTLSEPALSLDLRFADEVVPLEVDPERTSYAAVEVLVGELADGPYELRLSARDRAGNETVAPEVRLINLDQSAPELSQAALSEKLILTAAEVKTVSLLFTEPVSAAGAPGAPVVRGLNAGGEAIDFIAAGTADRSSAWTYNYVVPSSAPQGDFEIRLGDFADAAGNQVAGSVLGAVRIDTRAPAVVREPAADCAFQLDPLDGAATSFSFTVCLDEAVDLAGLTLRIDTDEVAGSFSAPSEVAPGVHAYAFTGTPPAASEGSFSLELQARDDAGNASTEILGLLVLDNLPPVITEVFLSPDRGSENLSTATITIVANERISGTPTLVTTPEVITPTSVEIDNATVRFTLNRSPLPNGLSAATVTLTDLAGNTATLTPVDPPALEIDASPPSFNATVSGGVALGGAIGVNAETDALRIAVTSLSDDLASVSVSLGSRLEDCDVLGTIECPDLIVSDLDEGPGVLSITALDEVGNLSVDLRSVFIDRTPPALSNPTKVITLDAQVPLPPAKITSVNVGTIVGVSGALATETLKQSNPPQLLLDGQVHADCVLDQDPTLITRCPGEPLTTLPVDPTPRLLLTDLVGNVAAVDLPALIIDTTPPDFPEVGRVTYRREPWGRVQGLDPDEPSFTVTVNEDALPEPLEWFFFSNANATGRLGSLVVDGLGPQLLLQIPADEPELFVVVVDGAGNRSPPAEDGAAPLDAVRWLATLNGKVPGSLLENPHQAHLLQHADGSIDANFFTQGATEFDGDLAQVGYLPRWRPVSPSVPGGRERHAMVWDPARRQAVLFGGFANNVLLGDTWLWDGRGFTQLPTNGPEPRQRHAMTFDPSRGAVMLFGGSLEGAEIRQDLWAFVGSGWQKLTTSGALPPPSFASQHLVYDDASAALRLLTVVSQSVVVCDLGPDLAWSCDTPLGGPSPNLLRYAAAAPGGDVLVVIPGGAGSQTFRLQGDAWLDEGAGPSASLTFDGAMVRTPAGEVILVEQSGRAFRYDDPGWTEILSPLAQPLGANFSLAADERSPLVFGGDSTQTLRRVEGTLAEVSFARAPARADAAHAEGIAPGEWVIFGGRTGGQTLADTWRLTPNGFRATLIGGLGDPPARHGASLARMDDGAPKLVLFGGSPFVSDNESADSVFADTWTFDGSTWTETGANSTGTFGGAATSFNGGQQVVRYGGVELNGALSSTTYLFDGSSWSELNLVNAPEPRARHTMVYDPVQDRAVLFGGTNTQAKGFLGDAHAFNGGWTLLGEGEVRSDHAAVHDGVETLVFGGTNTSEVIRISAAGSFEQQAAVNAPLPRSQPVMGTVGGDVFLFGGEVNGAVSDELFFLEGVDGGLPAVQFRVNLAAAGLADRRVVVRSVSLQLGGSAASTLGARLQAWSPAARDWVTVASTTASLGGPERITCAPCAVEAVGSALHLRAVPTVEGTRDLPGAVVAGGLEVDVSFEARP